MPTDDLYDRFIRPAEPRLIAAAWRVLRDEHLAADALQEALSRIWANRFEMPKHPNPEAWMLRLVLNAAFDALRRRRPFEAGARLIEITDPSRSLTHIEDRETRDRILDEIAQLSPQQTQAILLRLVENLPYSAVAEALDCSEATARVHVQRGREKLCSRLADLDPRPNWETHHDSA
jgi:RNA polymerase sigma-70 factor (ECF subfamily)